MDDRLENWVLTVRTVLQEDIGKLRNKKMVIMEDQKDVSAERLQRAEASLEHINMLLENDASRHTA